MKKKSLHLLFLVIVAGLGLAGCRSEVKLDDVTVDSKLKAKFSLPIGEMSVSFGQIMGLLDFGDQAVISVNDSGLYILNIDKHYDNEFHAIDLTDYTGNVASRSYIKESIDADIIPARTDTVVPFEMLIRFDGINTETSNERIDSMVIESASFTTRVSTVDFGLTDEDIDSVVMVLGPQFRRAQGTRRNLPDFKFGKDVTIQIDNFTLVMMKNEMQRPSNTNVVDTATITFLMYLNYKPNGNNNPFDPGFEYLPINPTSAFDFSFKVEMMEYNALYGFFKPGTHTHDVNSVDAEIKIPGSEPVVLAAKHPKIEMKFTHTLAIPLAVNLNEIKAIHPDGTETQALWNNSSSLHYPLRPVLRINEPYDATVTDSIIFSDHTDQGTIDRFFLKEVKQLGYDYNLDIDSATMEELDFYQCRMTKNTKFSLDFHFDMPFEFNKELKVTYSDTLRDINLERASLDSLTTLIPGGIVSKIDSAYLTLYLLVTNEIPVALKMDAIFLDEDGTPLDIAPDLRNIDLRAAELDGTPAVIPVTAQIKNKDFDALAKTKSVCINARLGNGEQETKFVTDKRLTIKAGIAADIQAALNLSVGQNNTNK